MYACRLLYTRGENVLLNFDASLKKQLSGVGTALSSTKKTTEGRRLGNLANQFYNYMLLRLSAEKWKETHSEDLNEIAQGMVGENTTLDWYGRGLCYFINREFSEAIKCFEGVINKFDAVNNPVGIYPCFDPSLSLCRLFMALCYECMAIERHCDKALLEKALALLNTRKVLSCADKIEAQVRVLFFLNDVKGLKAFLKKHPVPPRGNLLLWEAMELATTRPESSVSLEVLTSEMKSVLAMAELDNDIACSEAVDVYDRMKIAFDQHSDQLNAEDYRQFKHLVEKGREKTKKTKKKKGKDDRAQQGAIPKTKQYEAAASATGGLFVGDHNQMKQLSEKAGLALKIDVGKKDESAEAKGARKKAASAMTAAVVRPKKEAEHRGVESLHKPVKEVQQKEMIREWVVSSSYLDEIETVKQQIQDVWYDLDYAVSQNDFELAFQTLKYLGKDVQEGNHYPLLRLLVLQEKTYIRSKMIASGDVGYFHKKYAVSKERNAMREKKVSLVNEWLNLATRELSDILSQLPLAISLPDEFIINPVILFTDNRLREYKVPLLSVYLEQSPEFKARLAAMIAAIGHLISEGERIADLRGVSSHAGDFFRVANAINPGRSYGKLGVTPISPAGQPELHGAAAMPG